MLKNKITILLITWCFFIFPLQDGKTAEEDGLSSLEVVEAPRQTKSNAKQNGLYEPQNKAQALMKTGETPFHKQLGGDDGNGQGGSQIKQLQVTSENTVDGSITAKGKSEVSIGSTRLGDKTSRKKDDETTKSPYLGEIQPDKKEVCPPLHSEDFLAPHSEALFKLGWQKALKEALIPTFAMIQAVNRIMCARQYLQTQKMWKFINNEKEHYTSKQINCAERDDMESLLASYEKLDTATIQCIEGKIDASINATEFIYESAKFAAKIVCHGVPAGEVSACLITNTWFYGLDLVVKTSENGWNTESAGHAAISVLSDVIMDQIMDALTAGIKITPNASLDDLNKIAAESLNDTNFWKEISKNFNDEIKDKASDLAIKTINEIIEKIIEKVDERSGIPIDPTNNLNDIMEDIFKMIILLDV